MQARRSPARSTGCSKSHHDAEGRTSDNTALFKQWDPGVQRPVLWSLQAPPNPVLGPQRGLEARSPHHPGPRPPEGRQPRRDPGSSPRPRPCPCVMPPPIQAGLQLPSRLSLGPATSSRGNAQGLGALSPVSQPPAPPAISGQPPAPCKSTHPQPRPGRAWGEVRAQPPSPDSQGSSRVGRHPPPVPGWGVRLGSLTGVSASNSGAPDLPPGPAAPLCCSVLHPSPACRWFPTAVLLKGVGFHTRHWVPSGPSC